LAASARGVTNTPRDISIYLARALRGDSLKHIGEYFEIEKYSTVASAIARVKSKIMNDQEVAGKIERIVKAIGKS
jgi:chromosomal replication initiation ATPase DnaA